MTRAYAITVINARISHKISKMRLATSAINVNAIAITEQLWLKSRHIKRSNHRSFFRRLVASHLCKKRKAYFTHWEFPRLSAAGTLHCNLCISVVSEAMPSSASCVSSVFKLFQKHKKQLMIFLKLLNAFSQHFFEKQLSFNWEKQLYVLRKTIGKNIAHEI